MFEIKKIFNLILGKNNLTEKAKKNELSNDDWITIAAAFHKETGKDFYEAMEANEQNAKKAASHDAAMKLLAFAKPEGEKPTGEASAENPEGEASAETPDLSAQINNLTKKNQQLEKENKDKDSQIAKLGNKPEGDDPESIEAHQMNINGLGHTSDYAFGIQSDFYSTKQRWNRITVDPNFANSNKADEDVDAPKFQAAVSEFGKKLGKRYAELRANNALDIEKLNAGTTVSLPGAGSGIPDMFMVRRMDAIIAHILSIPNVYDFFPRRFGIQDTEVIFNALFGEVSQGWQKGRVFKGSVEIKPEIGHVDDVSIKLEFEPLTDIERNYLGYKNTEGSDAIKWGMIEWMLVGILEKAVAEQNKRKVLGIYRKPTAGTAGLAINGSTGIIYTLLRYQHQNKLMVHDDAAYADFDETGTVMLSAVKAFLADVVESLGDEEIDQFTLVLPKKYRPWWLENIREKYGKDNDFVGTYSNSVPDYDIPIYWLPVVAQKYMILTKPGNIQCLENVPGEMMNLKLSEDFENVLVRGRFKEGTVSAFVGKSFTTQEALVANDFEYQQIFMNKPVSLVADDATTVDVKAAKNFHFKTQENTTAGKKFTDFTNAKKGVAYILECGSVTNPQAIAKASKFDSITEAWTPTAVGDFIMVILNDAGDKFLELERSVGGVRSVNAALQPTLPEVRNA